MNVKEKLDKLRFRTFNIHGLITDVREYIDLNGTIGHSRLLVRDLLGREIEFNDELEARIFVKKMMAEIFKADYVVNPIDVDGIIEDCWNYTNQFVNDPQWSFLKAADEPTLGADPEKAGPIPNIVKKGPKKESKQDTVRRWYREQVIEGGVSSKDFGKKLVDELKMSKAGSLTYVFNAKKYWIEQGVISA